MRMSGMLIRESNMQLINFYWSSVHIFPNEKQVIGHLKVVSGEKEGGRKQAKSIGVGMGPWRWRRKKL